MAHTVRTTHIQRLIENGLRLARLANGQTETIVTGDIADLITDPKGLSIPVDHALAKAAADLRHAAEELEAERLSVLGWRQV